MADIGIWGRLRACLGLPWWLNNKESACSAGDVGDSGLIPGSGRSPGEGNGNPLQCSCWRIPWTEDPAGGSVWSHRVGTTENSRRACLGEVGSTVRSGHLHGGQSVPAVCRGPWLLRRHPCESTGPGPSDGGGEERVEMTREGLFSETPGGAVSRRATSFSGGSEAKESAYNAGDPGLITGCEDPLEKGMVTHSSILTWRIPWTEEPGRLQSVGSPWTEEPGGLQSVGRPGLR